MAGEKGVTRNNRERDKRVKGSKRYKSEKRSIKSVRRDKGMTRQ